MRAILKLKLGIHVFCNGVGLSGKYSQVQILGYKCTLAKIVYSSNKGIHAFFVR